MKKLLTLIVALMAFTFVTNAESTVYLFLKSMGNTDAKIFINGKEVTDMNASIKKTMHPDMYKLPLKLANDCTRKLTINNEGKTVIAADMTYTNPMKGTESRMKGEITLDLEDGETYYVEITNKGLTDVQLKLMDAKKGEKRKAEKKRDNLPDVTID